MFFFCPDLNCSMLLSIMQPVITHQNISSAESLVRIEKETNVQVFKRSLICSCIFTGDTLKRTPPLSVSAGCMRSAPASGDDDDSL